MAPRSSKKTKTLPTPDQVAAAILGGDPDDPHPFEGLRTLVAAPPAIELLAARSEKWPIALLEPYANNSRRHSEEQVRQLAEAFKVYGFTVPVLVDEDGVILAGHGRVQAAQLLGMPEVPVVIAKGWDEAKVRAYVIWDNRSAEMATWDLPTLKMEIGALEGVGFDMNLVGFDLAAIKGMELDAAAANGAEDGTYSRKIEPPIYTPKGDAPPVAELFDDAKAESLKARIRAADDLPADVARFLEKAAERHTVFNFHRIADFYASAPADTQRLMEESALVIIDFGQAIENGFVSLSESLAALAGNGGSGEDA